MSLVGGVPKSSSNRSASRDRCLGKEREDPSPAVVDHHERAGHLRQVDEARDIVQEGEVAQQRHGAAVRTEAAMPSAVDTTPSIPFAPRFACTREAWGAKGRTTRDLGWAWRPTPRAWHRCRPHGGRRPGQSQARSDRTRARRRWPIAPALPTSATTEATPRHTATRPAGQRPTTCWRRRHGTPSPLVGDPPTASRGRPPRCGPHCGRLPRRTRPGPSRATAPPAPRWSAGVRGGYERWRRPQRWSLAPCCPTVDRP